ncbi:MIP/aquaporin family protein [Aminobacter aganoensis]|uniref:Aquaporin Z n=1 Tax=Aminobacter aganoensis TaxID=83264 RepID=A0A7X0FDN1_9HYPH|nr:aquaporin Z [Aminobacter aganoensis]
MNKYIAELVGTAILIILGCGSVALTNFGSSGPVGLVAIALAFGFAVVGLAYALGPISGCHLNPAVTIAAFSARRLPQSQLFGYIIAQFVGTTIGAGILAIILAGKLSGYDLAVAGLGQNGWGEGYLGEFSASAAFTVEIIGTFVLCYIVLLATRDEAHSKFAGMAIGLTVVVLLLAFINVSGASFNPARSFGPAVFVGGNALKQLPLFLAAPVIGGLLAGLAARRTTASLTAAA